MSANKDIVIDIENIRNDKPRIGLTEFARSKTWHDDLRKCNVIEITERNDTAAYLVSPQGMGALIDTIDELEKEVEQLQVEAIFSARSTHQDWEAGSELAADAKSLLKQSKTAVHKAYRS